MSEGFRLVARIDWTLISNRIDDLDRRAKDMGGVFKRLVRPLVGDQRDHDKKAEGPEGKWAPRSEASEDKRRQVARATRRPRSLRTVELRPLRQRYRPPKKLLGRLPKALKVTTTPLSATVASRATFGGAHNSGAQVGRGRRVTLPKREFLWLSDAIIAYAEFEIATAVLGKDW